MVISTIQSLWRHALLAANAGHWHWPCGRREMTVSQCLDPFRTFGLLPDHDPFPATLPASPDAAARTCAFWAIVMEIGLLRATEWTGTSRSWPGLCCSKADHC